MKTRLFALLAVLSVIAILAMAFPTQATQASTDNEVTIQGTVQRLPLNGTMYGVWKIAGYKVHVSTSTQIDQTDGRAKVGANVSVEGHFLSNGSIEARSLDVLSAQSGQ